MMLGFLQQPTTVNTDLYYLAHQLGKAVFELELMPNQEFVHWQAYFKAKHALENMKPVEGGDGGDQ